MGAIVAGSVTPKAPLFAKSGGTSNSIVLTAMTGTAALLGKGQPETKVWHYNRQVPGSVLRLAQGSPTSIRLVNKLPQATTLHWHGLRIANAMDGVPDVTQKAVPSGKHFDYQFTPPDAGTYWYHSHNRTWEQLARGLYGIIVVEEKSPPKVDQDLVLAIDDWLIDNSGQIHEESLGAMHDWAHGGRAGNWITVNGAPQPQFPVVAGERLRLRLVNVANSRVMPLQFGGVKPVIVAIDGQPIKPVEAKDNVLVIAPGQRYDVMVDMQQDPGSRATLSLLTSKEPYEIASFSYDAKKVMRRNPLDATIQLPSNPLNSSFDFAGAKRVELLMQSGAMGGLRSAQYQGKQQNFMQLMQQKKMWAMNGVTDLPKKPLLRIKRGQTVIIDMINDNRWDHAMHLHGHHFKIMQKENSVGDAWRDTTLIQGGESQKLVFVADNPGKWLLHCHMVEHTAAGMITWLEVV
ncbi:MAG: multicopper oxidase family protein [Gammaproteobacteria bacterium]|nr:multicopper oxidase family protein [Gammaproteobacteria bacterium]